MSGDGLLTLLRLSRTNCIQSRRKVWKYIWTVGAGGAIFLRSVNPISTRWDRLCPVTLLHAPHSFRPSYGSVCNLSYGGNNGVNKQSRLLFVPNFCWNSWRFSILSAKFEKRHLNIDRGSDGIPVGKAVVFAQSLFKVTLY